MQLSPHVTQVTTQLAAAAALGDERTREIADSLAASLAPSVRLALLGALSQAADEITSVLVELPGSPTVAVRLDGDDAVVDVHLSDAPEAAEARERGRDDGEASARISLRLSEALKNDIDAAAARDGVSVNTWLVRAADAALNPNPFESLAAFGKTFGGGMPGGGPGGGRGRGRNRGGGHGGGQHVTGWING